MPSEPVKLDEAGLEAAVKSWMFTFPKMPVSLATVTMRDAIRAYLAAVPAPDTGKLRQAAERLARVAKAARQNKFLNADGDTFTIFNCESFADDIETLLALHPTDAAKPAAPDAGRAEDTSMLTLVVENEEDVISLTVAAEADDMLALASSIAGGDIVRVQVYGPGEKTLFLAAGASGD